MTENGTYDFENCAPLEHFFEALKLLESVSEMQKTVPISILAKTSPIVQTRLSFELADRLVSLIRLRRTNECYTTNGGVNDEEKLVDQSKDWSIKPAYATLLLTLLKKTRNQCEKDDLIRTDIAFRLKRCKGHSWVYFSSLFSKTQKGMTFELTLRPSSVPVILSATGPASCAQCAAVNPTFTCKKCKLVRYCSRQCQVANWKIHKENCKKLTK